MLNYSSIICFLKVKKPIFYNSSALFLYKLVGFYATPALVRLVLWTCKLITDSCLQCLTDQQHRSSEILSSALLCLLRAHEQELTKRHERELTELSAAHSRETQNMLSDFNKAQEVLKDKISALQILYVCKTRCMFWLQLELFKNPTLEDCRKV